VPDPRFRHEEPSLTDIEYLEDRLYEFNQAATGITDGRGLGVFLRDSTESIVAGAAGHTWGETCELRQVWVAEPLRRQGIGRSLLAEAEAEAVRRGCRQLVLTTHSFQAPQFYEKLGFTVVSEVPEYPRGHSQVGLRKPLPERAAQRGAAAARSVDGRGRVGAMDAEGVLEVIKALEGASVRVWVDGGWGVDALLGEQTRDHADLDLILDATDVGRLQEALHPIGYRVQPGGTEANFILAGEGGREIDVHPIEFDERGYGIFELGAGRRWPFPPAALAGRGHVDGHEVPCLSPDAQVQCHGQGYEPAEKDLRDMELLQERFGVVLPVGLCRQPAGR
jgi:lincosamide nucleotidyltransferase A/C/D/E